MAIEWAANSDSANNTGIRTWLVEGERRLALSPASATWNTVRMTAARAASGKWSVRYRYLPYSTMVTHFGLAANTTIPAPGTSIIAAAQNSPSYYPLDGRIYRNNAQVVAAAAGTTLTVNDEYEIEQLWDADTRELWIAVDGTVVFGGGDPEAGTTPAYTDPGSDDMVPSISIYQYTSGQVILLPPSGRWPSFTPWGYVAATITFASGAITDAAGNAVTESGVIASVCDRATGAQIATTTANVSGGAATLSFTADVTNGQNVVVHFHNTSGTLKAGGFLATVVV